MSVEFHPVASVSQVPTEYGLQVTIGQDEIALFKLDDGIYAIEGVCTHGAARLADGYVEGDLIECPQHAGAFEIKSGKAVTPPCVVDVKTYPVKIDGETVLVGVERA